MIKNLVIAYALFLSPTISLADSVARSIGNVIGEFSTGVGEAVGANMRKAITSQQPQWITINPRPKEECLAESGKVINAVYMRCRNGRQEYVRFDANGKKTVLSERPIPLY
jgi:hypothetical protein